MKIGNYEIDDRLVALIIFVLVLLILLSILLARDCKKHRDDDEE